MENFHRGKQAVDKGEYERAVFEFTEALKTSPESPQYFIQRSTALQRLKRYSEALDDANHAVVYAQKRAKREDIVEAQFRRAVALYGLDRFSDAEFVLMLVKQMKKEHKMADMWINKTALALKNLPGDSSKRIRRVAETPDLNADLGPAIDKPAQVVSEIDVTATSQPNSISAPTPALAPAPPRAAITKQQTAPDKIRQEWYQNNQTMYFSLLVKGVPKDKVTVEITERSLSISFPLDNGSTYDLTLEPLFAAVKPDKCETKVLPARIEIILVKAVPGQKWTAMESSEPVIAASTEMEQSKEDAVKRAVLSESKPTGPLYPSSSKSGPKDWDKITRDLRKAENSAAKKDSLDDDDEAEGGDEANNFFKKLFKGASPEVQRAMMKSYTESNGTALSTNWEEVSKGPVETVPPDGMEAKKWTS